MSSTALPVHTNLAFVFLLLLPLCHKPRVLLMGLLAFHYDVDFFLVRAKCILRWNVQLRGHVMVLLFYPGVCESRVSLRVRLQVTMIVVVLFEPSTPRTDDRFSLHDLDLPGWADIFLICVRSSSCCRVGAV